MSLSVPDQSSRNRSASTGASDLPEHEHKRPRLSESHPEEQMLQPAANSSDQNTTNSSPASSNSHHDNPALASPPHSPVLAGEFLPVASPTSKVTINTRPLSSQSSNYLPAVSGDNVDEEDTLPSFATVQAAFAEQKVMSDRADVHDTISISSSDDDSPPPIQIAAPEDFDQDPADTEWEPVSGIASSNPVDIGPGYVHRTFPFANSFEIGSAHRVLQNIASIFELGGSGDGQLFKQVKTWLFELTNNVTKLEFSVIDAEHTFWSQLPVLVSSLVKREVEPPAGAQVTDLVEFFVAFARLTKLVLDSDIARLHSYPLDLDGRTARNPVVMDYFQPLHWSLQTAGIPLYTVLRDTVGCNLSLVVDIVVGKLLESGASSLIVSMAELFDALSAFIPKRPQAASQVFNILQHAQFLIQSCASKPITVANSLAEGHLTVQSLLPAAQQFLNKTNGALERATVKQHAWLTIENCESIVKQFEQFIKVLVSHLPHMASEIIASAGVNPNYFAQNEHPGLAAYAWKLTTLRKLVTKGRMELRVYGIGTMADDLVRVFNIYIKAPANTPEHPIVRLMSHFIRDNELVRYIIGVDSHPQILNRSTNVVGFLCVSHTYQNDDTDVIWQTVLQSQDPRSGGEVLQVLQNNFENLDLNALSYIVQKLFDLPIERLNSHIFDFAWNLLRITAYRLNTICADITEAQAMNATTIKLCIKFLREGHTPQMIPTEISKRIRFNITDMLQLRLKPQTPDVDIGISSQELRNIIKELCADIQDHNSYACGSMLSINRIFTVLEGDLQADLIQQNDMTRLLVEDLIGFVQTMNELTAQASSTGCECRLSVLPHLILHAPDTFSEALLESIWLNLLSTGKVASDVRVHAWSHLTRICEACTVHNSVLDRLVSKYLPLLVPSEYDKAILDFVQQSVRYETRLNPPELMETGNLVVIPGIERVWQIMLRAPPNTVEVQAADLIVSEHLDSPSIMRTPLSAVENTHTALIDQCVQQAIEAAALLKDEQDSDKMSESPLNASIDSDTAGVVTLRFHRSLFFLRKFLDALKSRPRFSPAGKVEIKNILRQFRTKGDSLELTIQIHHHRSLESQPQKWIVGNENVVADLWNFISEITGWSQFNVIYGGGRVDWKDNTSTLRDTKIVSGMVMVSKVAGSPEITPSRSVRASSPVDNKVMHHFDDLYGLLELNSDLAREVYEFLTMFSSQEAILEKLRSMSIPADQLLPVEKPYKLLYYSRALRSCIEDESFSTTPNTEFLLYAVKTIVQTLSRFKHLAAEPSIRLSTANGLLEALLLAFRAKVSPEISHSYISDHSSFAHDVMTLWSQALDIQQSIMDVRCPPVFLRIPLEVLIEASLHDDRMWVHLSSKEFSDRISQSLIRHGNCDVRQAVLEIVYSLTGTSSGKTLLKMNDPRSPRMRFSESALETCMSQLWKVLIELVPLACGHPSACQQFFDAMISLLKVLGKKMTESEFHVMIDSWKTHLLNHSHEQAVGHPLKDFVIVSLGKLLLECFKLHPEIADELSMMGEFSREIFSSLLFPPLSEENPGDNQQVPVLDMHVRQVLYDLILVLSRTLEGLEVIAAELDSDLVPKGYFFQPTTNNERQTLRSEVGYAGLRNLSNTCYLNSLFSQLFMNVQFRDLLLNIDIEDESKQKLVVELGKVFAHMQNSYEDAVSPESAVEAITLWDGEQIDVAIQMDVDEFFNLLFDRLEFQILDPKMRAQFKSIYGGQLVQQIKSKECEHVSERLEPFSAVQVEIKGKSGLEESLKAYCEGEVLQGENKYACTGCGKHVDAIKRACLKDVPDHLIFNLKRFDYDIMTGMRCKVNDEFQFPDTIDIAPYTLDALSTPNASAATDMFELVGIVIHSGTAESGHYYSYVRQRPASDSKDRSWAQFNDHDVTRFDPASIRDCCFGGMDYGQVQCPKFYNGYMLFYQRASSIHRAERMYTLHDLNNPVKLPLPSDLETYIAQQNELYLRSHVAQSPVHAKFIKQLLQQLSTIETNQCSNDHKLEKQIHTLTLEYINQMSARWKDQPEVEETLKTLEVYAERCHHCAAIMIEWFLEAPNLMDNLVRCCYPAVRKSFLHLICTCWQSLADQNNQQLSENVNDLDQSSMIYIDLLERFLGVLGNGWETIQRFGRAWEQYFGLLSFLARLGDNEAHTVIDQRFLERGLELVHVHVNAQTSKRLRVKYQAYLLQRERSRPFSHGSLIQFIAEILQYVVFDASTASDGSRVKIGNKVGLLEDEEVLFGFDHRPPKFTWLKKIILGGYNTPAMDTIVASLSKIRRMNGPVAACMKDGLAESTIINAVSFLRPTLTFISQCVLEAPLTELVNNALELIESTGGNFGNEFLSFVKQIGQVENHELQFGRGMLTRNLYDNMKSWAPVLLMHPNDMHSDVRGDTLDYINELLFSQIEEARRSDARNYRALLEIATELAEACASYVQRHFLNPNRKEPLSLQAGQAVQILTITDNCLPLFGDTAEDEDRASRINMIMDDLRQKSDVIVETMSNTEWKDASSDLEALSEVDLSELSP